MKSIVIGGAGFIGSHLCDALLAEGCQVICVDNFSLGRRNNIAHLLNEEKFTLYEADASEEEEIDIIFKKEKPDYVFHLAANSDIQASSLDPSVEYKNTYTTTFQILLAMKKYGIKNLFFASTSAVYGDKRNEILTESTANLSPISYYGASKLGSEALISSFSYMNDIQVLIFRFPNVIGPRLTHGVIFDFIQKLKNNPRKLQILGDGKQTKPYIYVLDLIDAIIKFKDTKQSRVNIYNVGGEGSTSVTTIANMICEEKQLKDVEYIYTGGESGWKGDVPRFQYSTEKINSAGWKAKYTSDEAVRETIRNHVL